MTTIQFDLLLTMLCSMRVALLGIVDALEVYLIAQDRLKTRTSDMRRLLKAERVCDRMIAE